MRNPTKLELALSTMKNRIQSGFNRLVKPHRDAIEAAHKVAKNSKYEYEGVRHGCGPSSNIDHHVVLICDLEKDRDDALSWIEGIESFKELIEAGLLPISEAIQTVSRERGNKARLAMGHLIAAPGHELLRRERNMEINDLNDAAEEAERAFGITLPRCKTAPSDSIQEHDNRPSRNGKIRRRI